MFDNNKNTQQLTLHCGHDGKNLWTMDDDKEFKKELIDYIEANDKEYAKESLDNCSVTALTIIKTGIEIRLHNSKKKK